MFDSPDPEPANPALSTPARAVLAYVQSLPGEGLLLGQQENDLSVDAEQSYIRDVTGKRPAVRGFDAAAYIVDTVDEAIEAWREHGQLVTLSWHLCRPLTDGDFENVLDSTEGTYYGGEADVEATLTEGTAEHAWLLDKFDRMADDLGRLQAAGVPVLWRPFHEMDGGWFWWSNAGPEGLVGLWELMYEHFVDRRGLDNLVWVWSRSHELRSGWYPGDEYVDVAGVDTYRRQIPDLDWERQYEGVRDVTATKPVALAECDELPDPDAVRDRYPFVWALPWHGSMVRYNDEDHLGYVYDHPNTITAGDLPEFQ